ncbi:MAG TPA: N-acetylmuramoyl-L-alanine amidase [Candidatus Acidoferrum sp.]|nr:N-acetylmuramoyl-L-alanine amidase [Candidatus Acidoferrum sp.]
MLRLRKGPRSALIAAGSLLFAVLAAGCAADRHRADPNAADWNTPALAAQPAAAPAPTPPAAPAPPPKPPAEPPPAPAPPLLSTGEVFETWVPLQDWCKSAGLSAPCQVSAAPTPAYALVTSNGVFVLRAGSQALLWDGLECRLGFAPEVVQGQPFVHSLDLKKTLEPLMANGPVTFLKTNPSIVIDPGHGGEDSGTRSILGNHYEREYTLDWAQRLAGLLSTNGWQVFLTRTNDVHISLSNRVAFAEDHKAGLFLSLHFNSAGANLRESGLETYCLTPAGMFSSLTRGYDDDPGLIFPNNAFDAENVQLAAWVHRALLQVNGRNDRGVRRARYLSVLRAQNRPAILVEGGYLSNPTEARRIADPAYRQKLAEAIAKALVQHYDIHAPNPEPPLPTLQVQSQSLDAVSTNLVRP